MANKFELKCEKCYKELDQCSVCRANGKSCKNCNNTGYLCTVGGQHGKWWKK